MYSQAPSRHLRLWILRCDVGKKRGFPTLIHTPPQCLLPPFASFKKQSLDRKYQRSTAGDPHEPWRGQALGLASALEQRQSGERPAP